MTDDREMMRAADSDRDEVIARLRGALDEGRLKMDEFMERMGLAQEALTYGDLAKLHADLPVSGSVSPKVTVPARARVPAPVRGRGAFARLPVALKVLWTIWAAGVAVNVVVWALVCMTTARVIYPWPLWVAGPAGAALLAVSAALTAGRHGHHPDDPRTLPPGNR